MLPSHVKPLYFYALFCSLLLQSLLWYQSVYTQISHWPSLHPFLAIVVPSLHSLKTIVVHTLLMIGIIAAMCPLLILVVPVPLLPCSLSWRFSSLHPYAYLCHLLTIIALASSLDNFHPYSPIVLAFGNLPRFLIVIFFFMRVPSIILLLIDLLSFFPPSPWL